MARVEICQIFYPRRDNKIVNIFLKNNFEIKIIENSFKTKLKTN